LISSHSGLVLLNKPNGITSFKVLNTLKKQLNSGKVGHTGTLDKFAEGLMLVLTGKMTKLAPYFSNMDKEYNATFKIGEETTTLDPEGEIIAKADIPTIETIEKNIPFFLGDIMQQPPDFSAIHINGKRAYKLAAAGQKPDLPKRPVSILNYTIVNWKPPYLYVNIKCSKGTYIRSLARDLGSACNSRAYVSALKRSEVGKWKIEDSISPQFFNPDKHIVTGKMLFNYLDDINILNVNFNQSEKILKGYPVHLWMDDSIIIPQGSSAIFDNNDSFLAMIENEKENLSYKFVQDRS
jgi:tRNA pseudouridine55 synthase